MLRWRGGAAIEILVQGTGQQVRGQYVGTAAQQHRRGVRHRLEGHPQPLPDPLRRQRLCFTRGSGHCVQMGAFGVIESQRSRQGVQYGLGDVDLPAAFQPHVVVHADPGKLRDFFSAQAGHPAYAGQGGQAHFF
jgi:hypothetical protein